MWTTIAQDLEQKTARYWRISLAWNSKSPEQIPTGEAIESCTSNLKYTNPGRPIAQLTTRLLGEIIQGEGSPHPEESDLINFPDILDIITENMQ